MKNTTAPIIIAVLMFGCQAKSKYEFWNISRFNLQPNSLESKEEIRLIYSSRGPDFNEDQEYYVHIIAVSQKTGDTVNVLTPFDNAFSTESGDEIFNYFGPSDDLTKMAQLNSDSLQGIKHVDQLDKIEPKQITKVARDPAFDNIADNKFPTVIGVIGKITNTPKTE